MQTELESLWKTYDTINNWIRFSDTKAVAIIAIFGVIISFLSSNITDVKYFILTAGQGILLIIGIGVICASLSMSFCIRCLTPRLKVKVPSSLIFFAHVAKNFENPDDYEKSVKETFKDEEQMITQIANQVWANSKVAQQKYNNVVCSIRFFCCSLVFSFIGICIFIFT